MSLTNYKPIFPYFGGKSKIAHEVWSAFGEVNNYVEPFFGSGAVLMLRPQVTGTETVNDADGLLSNFWRSVKADPEATAHYADWPVNEADLHARHLWLLGQRERITERLMGDVDFYDAKAAGYWVWGICCWIGSGWCSGQGPWSSVDGVLTNAGQGIKRQLPHLGNAGRGINRKLPHLGDAGRGINRKLPHLGNAGQAIFDMFAELHERLAQVRVCCGDWMRVMGDAVTVRHGLTAVFLDPPYANTASRDPNLYAMDCLSVAHDVRRWAIANGDNPKYRIALCGYEGEHVMPDSWRVLAWKTNGGYASQGSKGKINSNRERIWFSPHCITARVGDRSA